MYVYSKTLVQLANINLILLVNVTIVIKHAKSAMTNITFNVLPVISDIIISFTKGKYQVLYKIYSIC
jgi:hypothetical protein